MKSQFTKQKLNKFLSYYRPHKRIFAVDMFFAGLSAVSALLFPLVSGYITKVVLSDKMAAVQGKLLAAGLILLLLTIVKMSSNVLFSYYGHAMGTKMECTMRKELFLHYEQLSFGFHAKNSVGKLMTVMSGDLTGMTEVFHHGPENILMTFIKFAGAFVILININIPMTLIVFSVLPVLCYAAFKTDKIMEHALISNKNDLSEMNEYVEDALSGIRTVKAFGNEEAEAIRFSEKNDRYTNSKCHFYKVEALFYDTMESYPQFLTMLTIFFGAVFIGRGSLDIPVLVIFLLYVGCLAEPINITLGFMKLYEEGKAGFIRFMDMMETKPIVTENEHAEELRSFDGNIVFDRVSFRYEDFSENVLENISLTIKKGETAAFVGATGIGKTTVSSLIARFYDATEGNIILDGTNIKNISFKSLREHIGIVQQEVYIFNGTIRDNISYGRDNATDDEIKQAAKLADIHDFICSLPEGYGSMVGTRGIMLSGGQRQRISIARLFLKNPEILILDEATSALDYESEAVVQKSLERLMEKRTSIIIAHRLSTIKNADVIYVLSDKKVTEHGTHEQLMAHGRKYASIQSHGAAGLNNII